MDNKLKNPVFVPMGDYEKTSFDFEANSYRIKIPKEFSNSLGELLKDYCKSYRLEIEDYAGTGEFCINGYFEFKENDNDKN